MSPCQHVTARCRGPGCPNARDPAKGFCVECWAKLPEPMRERISRFVQLANAARLEAEMHLKGQLA